MRKPAQGGGKGAVGGLTSVSVALVCKEPGRPYWSLSVDIDLLQVSATFAASLVTSPAIGAYLGRVYGDSLVVVLATAIALLDICFILVAVPESLPEKMRPASWGAPISWEQADPFASLKKVGQDSIVLLICITVFLSYLPEAGQYSSFFLYLRQVKFFSTKVDFSFIV